MTAEIVTLCAEHPQSRVGLHLLLQPSQLNAEGRNSRQAWCSCACCTTEAVSWADLISHTYSASQASCRPCWQHGSQMPAGASQHRLDSTVNPVWCLRPWQMVL